MPAAPAGSRHAPCDVHESALDHIGSRHIGDDPQPPAAVRADREINRARSHRERNADCDAISQTPCAGAPSRSWVPWVGGRGLRGALCPAHEHRPARGCDAADLAWLEQPCFDASRSGPTVVPVPVISDQVAAWPRHQRRQPSQEVQRVEHEVRGAIAVRILQLVDACPASFVLSRSSASACPARGPGT